MRKQTSHKRSHEEVNSSGQKIVKRNYHVKSQTAYHITKLAMESGTSEGRIIDKIMRTYLAGLSQENSQRPNIRF